MVVIGSGDTAKDCVRTVIRHRAKSVTCLSRRDRANMPGSQREHILAEEEGVTFDWMVQPKGLEAVKVYFVQTAEEAISEGIRVDAIRTILETKDGSGRQVPVAIPGSEFSIDADIVINALGYSVAPVWESESRRLGTNARGALLTQPRSQRTELPDVYAIGDAARGPSLVVWAIKEGRDVAAEIHAKLSSPIAQHSARAIE